MQAKIQMQQWNKYRCNLKYKYNSGPDGNRGVICHRGWPPLPTITRGLHPVNCPPTQKTILWRKSPTDTQTKNNPVSDLYVSLFLCFFYVSTLISGQLMLCLHFSLCNCPCLFTGFYCSQKLLIICFINQLENPHLNFKRKI